MKNVKVEMCKTLDDGLGHTSKAARSLKKRVRRQVKRATRKTTRQWIEGQG